MSPPGDLADTKFLPLSTNFSRTNLHQQYLHFFIEIRALAAVPGDGSLIMIWANEGSDEDDALYFDVNDQDSVDITYTETSAGALCITLDLSPLNTARECDWLANGSCNRISLSTPILLNSEANLILVPRKQNVPVDIQQIL